MALRATILTGLVFAAVVFSQEKCPPQAGETISQWQESKWQEYKARLHRHPLSYVCGLMPARGNSSQGAASTAQYVVLCCPGFTEREDVCAPQCRHCELGVCEAPGSCVCYPGYTQNRLGQCVLTCPCGCPHGQCYGDTCICDSGYELDVDTHTCAPICQDGCVNGDCVEPSECSCHLGFSKSSHHICAPHHGCAGCQHGDCVGTGDCRCHEGYRRHHEDCVPVCSSRCVNGFCAAPDTCECSRGYVKVTRTRCAFGCALGCFNADCVGLNQCECHEGFYKRDPARTPNVCYPVLVGMLEAASSHV